MPDPDNCAKCGVSLIGGDIPEHMHEFYSPPYFWRRELGMEYPELYDGVYEYKCPDCGHTWLSEAGIIIERRNVEKIKS